MSSVEEMEFEIIEEDKTRNLSRLAPRTELASPKTQRPAFH